MNLTHLTIHIPSHQPADSSVISDDDYGSLNDSTWGFSCSDLGVGKISNNNNNELPQLNLKSLTLPPVGFGANNISNSKEKKSSPCLPQRQPSDRNLRSLLSHALDLISDYDEDSDCNANDIDDLDWGLSFDGDDDDDDDDQSWLHQRSSNHQPHQERKSSLPKLPRRRKSMDMTSVLTGDDDSTSSSSMYSEDLSEASFHLDDLCSSCRQSNDKPAQLPQRVESRPDLECFCLKDQDGALLSSPLRPVGSYERRRTLPPRMPRRKGSMGFANDIIDIDTSCGNNSANL